MLELLSVAKLLTYILLIFLLKKKILLLQKLEALELKIDFSLFF